MTTVHSTIYNDGSADFTIQRDEESHQFSASTQRNSSNALLSYEETLSERGVVRVSQPPHEVWGDLMMSDEMTEYLESQDGITGVTRENR